MKLKLMGRVRYSGTTFSISPLRPFALVCSLVTTPLDPSDYSEHTCRRPSGLVAAMVLVKAVEGLDKVLGDLAEVA